MTDLFYGVDLSMWNAVSDANAMRGNNITYAWVKATEGTGYVDPTFFAKVAQLRAAGIVVGGYHFMRSGSVAAQAMHFRQVAGDAGCLNAGSLMPMNDMESADARDGADSMITQFYDAIGVSPMDVYANLDWWRNVINYNAWGRRNLMGHLAHYNGDPGRPGWTYPRAAVHQHTSSGTVPGIAGNVDRNATMNGYDLRSITIGNSAPPSVPPDSGAAPPVVGDTWEVRPGDTLARIASAWGVTVSAVAVANGIPNADLIYVGQLVHRPGTATAAPSPVAGSALYTVRAGDTLSGIAAAHGTTVAVLVALNGVSNPDRIMVGQVLRLPDGAAPAARVYIVAPGDTLGVIAARLGYPGGYLALAARNGISNPDHITPGQRLYY